MLVCVSKVLGLQRPRLCHVMLGRVGGCPVLIVLQVVHLLPSETFTTLEGKRGTSTARVPGAALGLSAS